MAFLITPIGGKAAPEIATLSDNTKVDRQSRAVFVDKLQIAG